MVSMNQESEAAVDVVICVPTFRRRDRLAQLLEGISQQDYSGRLALVVADNDAENPTVATLDIPTNLAEKLSWFTVAERGVSIVRNRLVEFAVENFPNAKWIAFIDDDEVPSQSWLQHLISTGTSNSSDLVGGPVVGVLPRDASIFARNSMYAVRRPQRSGPIDMLIGTNNLLISIKFLRKMDRTPFLAEFGRTGGEDYEFLRYAKSVGGKFSWSEEAVVSEDVEPHRLDTKALLKRYLGVGAYHARIDKRYLAWQERMQNLSRRLRWLTAATIRAIAGIEVKKNLAESILATAATVGYLAGLCGVRINLY